MNSVWDDAMGQVTFLVAVGTLLAIVVIIGGMVFVCYLGYQAYRHRFDPPDGLSWTDRPRFSEQSGDVFQFGERLAWN